MASAASALELSPHVHFRIVAERSRDLFSALTRKRIRWRSFHSLVDLQAAINRYLAEHNADPTPFIWTAPPTAILTKLSECSV